ncbi:hypothetical protein PQX77_010251 [Marasmius sp. AFHP31]|nr:hypothetical protein PQX77_010251 [Marasmius sp. AFHP31]
MTEAATAAGNLGVLCLSKKLGEHKASSDRGKPAIARWFSSSSRFSTHPPLPLTQPANNNTISRVALYGLFANASTTPPVRALFFEFPNEPELFGLDKQFMIGRDILVTPVLSPNVTSVEGIFPGRGQVVWRHFITHEVVKASDGKVTLEAPLGHINVHIRDGSAILMHAKPANTTEETRQGPFSLLVSLASNGGAFGSYYLDDGVSNPPGASTTLSFVASDNQLQIRADGEFTIGQQLEEITILGVSERPSEVTVQNSAITTWEYDEGLEQIKLSNLTIDLNGNQDIAWRVSA